MCWSEAQQRGDLNRPTECVRFLPMNSLHDYLFPDSAQDFGRIHATKMK